jgi:hypothetical protein
MTFAVEPVPRIKGDCEYRYRIYEDGRLIADYWHDHRGDDHGIEFVDGKKEHWPVGRMTEFLEGGGKLPLSLSTAAVDYLGGKCI